jgi:hypothetical protein
MTTVHSGEKARAANLRTYDALPMLKSIGKTASFLRFDGLHALNLIAMALNSPRF